MTKVAVAVEGWNAEAAIGFALAARKFASSVTLTSSRETVDGKDEIELMTFGPEPGEEILMAVDGTDEKVAFDTLLAKLLSVTEPLKSGTGGILRGVPEGRPVTRLLTLGMTREESLRGLAEKIAALDVEEVAPGRAYSKRMPRKKAHRKQDRKSGRKSTTTRHRPRKRKK